MLRFIFGASGAGKSRLVYDEFIKRSMDEPDRNFLIVVPDQFTMQTQMDIVKLHPRHGIMNIDVISFSRLAHRIFEEVGEDRTQVLDDMGKSLVLRHVAETLSKELPVIGSNMHKMGYIDEVKSTISEFMQYRIEPGDLDKLLEASKTKGALRSKLTDLQKLYSGFKEYIKGNFIAREETMEVLCRALPKSELIPESVIVFDGFTGFTPIQYQVIGVLLALAGEVIVTCTIGQDENPYKYDKNSEQELFLLSKKTVHDILHLEYENEKSENPGSVPDFERWAEYRNAHSGDIFLNNTGHSRHAGNAELSFLEENLFRYNRNVYEGEVSGISIIEAEDIYSEVRMIFSLIREMIREKKGLHYRDFAIVCGDIERYAPQIEKAAGEYGVPVYLDRTGVVKLNPFIEFIRGGLSVVNNNYSYESVLHYLRSGIPDFTGGEDLSEEIMVPEKEDIDELENYIRAVGIRGKKAWENDFYRIPSEVNRKLKTLSQEEAGTAKEAYLKHINMLRMGIQDSLKPLFEAEGKKVSDYCEALYNFIVINNCVFKLSEREKYFREKHDEIRAKEYDVIYRKVMDLINQISELMGEERISFKEFADILEVGIGDIEIGTIPAGVDRIVAGDIERTRLKEVKNLFFIGATDDLIPKGTGTGGIISDIERQFLVDSGTGIEMAPTPRQQMYIQRLYLYMNLTKPSEKLFLSYSQLDPAGKSIRPAYIVGKIKNYFPKIKLIATTEYTTDNLLQTGNNGLFFVAENMQKYVKGHMSAEDEEDFTSLYQALWKQGDKYRERLSSLISAAETSYKHHPLPEAVASLLYGNVLVNSVSRLEKFAQCSYAHFLRYGLLLNEREEFSFEYSDMGNVFHGVLESFSKNLESRGLTWIDFTKEQGEEILLQSFETYVADYESDILNSTSRNMFSKERMKRILLRSVDTLQYQLKKGSFMPRSMETEFSTVGNIDAINVNLTEDERGRILKRMKLTGRIDRIDACEDQDHVYLKVIDFKSGNKKFDLCALYYGLQLQLVMYMNVARGIAKAENPSKEIVPAAILYYHLDDPVLDGENVPENAAPDDINMIIRKQLRPNGIVAMDRDIVSLLDGAPGRESDVVPVKFKTDGDFAKSSGVMGADEFEEVSEYVKKLIKSNGRKIVSGDVAVTPYEMGDNSACNYCDFRSICGFDPSIPGYKKKTLSKLSDDEVMNNIRVDED